jgi:hypothetical protein
LERVDALLGKLHGLLRDINGSEIDGQVRSHSLESPRNRVDLGPFTASKNRHVDAGAAARLSCQPAHQFEFCAVPEETSAVILAPIRELQDQGVQVGAISDQHGKATQTFRNMPPDATNQPQISSYEKVLDNMQNFSPFIDKLCTSPNFEVPFYIFSFTSIDNASNCPMASCAESES